MSQMSLVKKLKDTQEYKQIESDVEKFVKEKLNGYIPTNTESKTIHDSVWGSIEYSEWEMQLIDSPLMQRLRDIQQVGLAMLTYPAARHSRFEHSLGVAAAAKKMCERVNANSQDFKIDEENRNCIILAALVHDIGHCFYSHLSESIYGELQDFVALRRQFNTILSRKPKPHEILSFIIVNTTSFQEFFFSSVNYPNKGKVESSLFVDVGCMIIGANVEKNNKILSYQTAIINGPFDADKLDYIRRDSLTAGLALQYDIERLFTKIQVHSIPAPTTPQKIEHRLVINFNGVTAIEELTFCKIMLFSYIYYHQKVLITETLIKDYAYGLYELKIIDTFSDFLRFTDSQILTLSEHQKGNPFPKYDNLDLKSLAENVKLRKLPKRCLEISQSNVECIEENVDNEYVVRQCEEIIRKCKNDDNYGIKDLKRNIEILSSVLTRSTKPVLDELIAELSELTYPELLDRRKEFYNLLVEEYKNKGLNVTFNMFDIFIVFPKLVNYGATTEAVVLGKDHNELMTINDFVKLDDWASSFNSNKWRGYIFITDKVDKSIAFDVAQQFVLKGKAKLKNPAAYLKGIEE